jgi:hypothetical protein
MVFLENKRKISQRISIFFSTNGIKIQPKTPETKAKLLVDERVETSTDCLFFGNKRMQQQ